MKVVSGQLAVRDRQQVSGTRQQERFRDEERRVQIESLDIGPRW
jgi:hypothetical protein